jgi:hypothetical protein
MYFSQFCRGWIKYLVSTLIPTKKITTSTDQSGFCESVAILSLSPYSTFRRVPHCLHSILV